MNQLDTGIVAANFGKELQVLCPDGTFLTCELAGLLNEKPVPGDRVTFSREGDKRYLTRIEERRGVLRRAGKREGDVHILAAHIEAALVVSAVKPSLKEGLIDRYLVALHHEGITPVIVLNKIDLDSGEALSRIRLYEKLGYDTHAVSAVLGTGMSPVQDVLAGKTSVLVGQSGVGKSSLLMALLPGVKIGTGEVSAYSGKGVHTTTTARMYCGPNGARIIDSPGIRSFGLSGIVKGEVARYFVEMQGPSAHCRFRDCMHLEDQGCAVKAALLRGDVSTLRYDSYRRIVDSL